eukprot:1156927-Pelagomonas_calceolata.AAC.2
MILDRVVAACTFLNHWLVLVGSKTRSAMLCCILSVPFHVALAFKALGALSACIPSIDEAATCSLASCHHDHSFGGSKASNLAALACKEATLAHCRPGAKTLAHVEFQFCDTERKGKG